MHWKSSKCRLTVPKRGHMFDTRNRVELRIFKFKAEFQKSIFVNNEQRSFD